MNARPFIKILAFFAAFIVVFAVMRLVFVACYASLMGEITFSDVVDIVGHGLAMDASMAGYLTIIPALIITCSTITSARWLDRVLNVYTAISAFLISFVALLDIVLYGYWNFRLDTTPFFYFFTSPASAMASASIGEGIGAVVGCAALTALFYLAIRHTAGAIKITKTRHWGVTALSFLMTAALIIPIRGSFTVSTMNLSRAYFSANQRFNHAAINPMFSLMYSATHQDRFDSEFRFFDADRAERLFADLHQPVAATDSVILAVNNDRPDIYIIILESFSSHLMPSLGGEDVASGLDSIARKSVSFANFYASGARTDRALPAILSAFPAQPTTSLMKYTRKIEHTPSLPAALKEQADYHLTYYYGGDANFTNMLAYLMSCGFDEVISDKDFDLAQRRSKWGAHDDVLFVRVWTDLSASDSDTPTLRVIQTSSSHEPFEVPYADPRFADNDRANAFAFTDKQLQTFIDRLADSPRWDNSLIVITADHYGAYPQGIEDPLQRHRIPLVITGGALSTKPTVVETIADQTALAATILSMLGLDSSNFDFSRDVSRIGAPQYAFISEPGIAGIITANDTIVLSLDNDAATTSRGVNPEAAADTCKAVLQTIYTTISQL